MEGGHGSHESSRKKVVLLQGFVQYLSASVLHGVRYLTEGDLFSKIIWVGISFKCA